MKKLTKEEFVEKAIKIHGQKYNYSKVIYSGIHNKICIICSNHGEFFQTPHNHVINKQDCPKCVILGKSPKSTKQFIEDAKKIHKNIYDYSIVNYKNALTNIKIICKIHGVFEQNPNVHLKGHGCPKCGFLISKLETEFLDYLQVPKRCFYLPEWKKKSVDGYEPSTNTVYEFLGDYYHGNPKIFDINNYNKTCHKTFGELHERTLKTLNRLKSFGYNTKYVWENDWCLFKEGSKTLIVHTL